MSIHRSLSSSALVTPFQSLPLVPAPLWSISSAHGPRDICPQAAPHLPPTPSLQSLQRLCQLTQQDDDAQQDGNQSAGAEARGGEERLALAHSDSAVALAWAHPQGQGAGAGQRRLPAVPHHDGQLVQLLCQVVETPPPGNNAGRAVCNEK